MDLEVGPFVIFFPSASSPGFSMHHDLAGVFGLDYNRDAVAALRAAPRELDEAPKTGVVVDHEADAVFVEARSAMGMGKALRAIERAAARPLFEPGELARACAAMRAWRRPRPLAYDLGAACSVALADGSVGAVVVAGYSDWPARASTPKGDRACPTRCPRDQPFSKLDVHWVCLDTKGDLQENFI